MDCEDLDSDVREAPGLAPLSSPWRDGSARPSNDSSRIEPSGREAQDSARRARRSSIDKAMADLEKEKGIVKKLSEEMDELPASGCSKKEERKKKASRLAAQAQGEPSGGSASARRAHQQQQPLARL
mmetsp:Transcript_28228/g.86249  ORF Transcript_28228/g.86249 Transcript_28228/m.86249 type:complete len:127 (-) Transcript_28228:646-1026(-)